MSVSPSGRFFAEQQHEYNIEEAPKRLIELHAKDDFIILERGGTVSAVFGLEVGQTYLAGKELRDDSSPQRHHEEDVRQAHLQQIIFLLLKKKNKEFVVEIVTRPEFWIRNLQQKIN